MYIFRLHSMTIPNRTSRQECHIIEKVLFLWTNICDQCIPVIKPVLFTPVSYNTKYCIYSQTIWTRDQAKKDLFVRILENLTRTVIVKVVLMLDLDYKMSASGTTAEATAQGAQGSFPKHPKLNVSTASTLVSNLLAVETACTTPRTPEILNSLIAMTNPLDDYNYNNASEKCAIGGPRVSIYLI